MKHKRLDRDIWWTYNKVQFPHYYQMRIDTENFHGLVCLLQLIDGVYQYWEFPLAGKAAVIGKGMTWLQLIPDGKKHLITAKYIPEKKTIRGVEYTNSVSVWYVDIIEDILFDTDGVAVYVDKYLDVIFTPRGDVKIDDRDELDGALATGDISTSQYNAALQECDFILENLCRDIEQTEIFCNEILAQVHDRIEKGEKEFNCKCDNP